MLCSKHYSNEAFKNNRCCSWGWLGKESITLPAVNWLTYSMSLVSMEVTTGSWSCNHTWHGICSKEKPAPETYMNQKLLKLFLKLFYYHQLWIKACVCWSMPVWIWNIKNKTPCSDQQAGDSRKVIGLEDRYVSVQVI